MSGGSKVTTTTSEPWLKQQKYLEEGFEGAKSTYMPEGKPTLPGYYPGATVAGFDPTQQASQAATLAYTMGTRPEAMMKASENQLLGMYDVSKQIPDYAMGRGDAAQNYMTDALGAVKPTYTDLMSGKVDYKGSPYRGMADVYGQQYLSEIQKNMPAVRQSMVEFQPGGGSRGDIVQGQIAGAAGKNLAQNLAGLYGGAYTAAQQRVPQFMQQYPTVMGAPMGMYGAMGDVGAARRSMSQEAINRDMARYQYNVNAPQQALGNYMSMISGDYGGTTTQTGPKDNSATIAALGSVAAAFISDERLKENIEKVGSYKGLNVYEYNYLWSPVKWVGFIAQEVEKIIPEAVLNVNGFKIVDYGKIS